MTLHAEPLDVEDQEAVIADARAGDLESLQEIFTTLIHPKMLKTCVDEDSGSTALHMAAANGHLEVVKYIWESVKENYSADETKEYVNKQNGTGNTALHWATLNGKLDVVEYLCDECDADPFMKNEFGHDSIFEAENNGREEVENYFLKKYDVEPESESEGEEESTPEVQITEGTEIEEVTKEATEALAKKTESLSL
ncbi:Ankyrin repeat-containing protein YAR1 [Nakaseomyces bracarensis]|uniref:Ankyrin repeat-containing protein YAR1 n=1 Tax=Nakaseomyces bracarensis TaxID=273131 RepID=A0ABR4NRD5_9SACH